MSAVMSPRPSILPWLGLAALVMIADQGTKAWVVDAFQLHDSVRVTPFFNLVRVHNAGAAFSFLADASGWQRWFFTLLGVVAGAFIVWMLAKHRGQTLFSAALALILGGAIGNVVDRVMHGHVVDFVQVHAGGWYFPAFNVADSAITVGAALLIWDEIRRLRRGR